MQLKVTLDLDNDAFGSTQFERTEEIEKCLLRLVQTVKSRWVSDGETYKIYDSNGNSVGFAFIIGE